MHSHHSLKTVVISSRGLLLAGLLIYAQAQPGRHGNTHTLGMTERKSAQISLKTQLDDTPALTDSWLKSVELENELVRYPSPLVAFICGPQLKVNSPLNPFPWFDSTQIKSGNIHGQQAPSAPPRILTGLVSASPNTRVVTGQGTRFLSEVDPSGRAPFYNGWLRILDGRIHREVRVASVESDTRLILTSNWRFGPVGNVQADTFHYDENQASWNYDLYYNSSYYDTALVEYINYYRTGSPEFLRYARKMADGRWRSQYLESGTITQGPNHLPPRSQAFAGLILRALDDRPEHWDYLYREIRATFDNWLKMRRNNEKLYYDIREAGYAQLYAVMLARVLPDTYPLYGNGTLKPSTGMARDGARKREALLTDAEDIAVNYFGRLQHPDGSWRWDADGGPDPNSKNRNVEQPFMVGLYLESVVLLHQLTANAKVKANLVNQLTRSVRHLYHDTYEKNNPVTNFPPYKWRGFFYFWGGGTVAEPKKYSPTRPSTTACGLSQCGDGSVTMARHLNSTIHHAFGYAYFVTGKQEYRDMGDEVFDASYGDRVDGIHGLADSEKGKDYAMNYRASGRYLVWRLAGSRDTKVRTASEPAAPNASVANTRQNSHNSVELVSDCLNLASGLAASLSDKEQIKALIGRIETAQLALKRERSAIAQAAIGELEVALANARTALSIAAGSGSYDSARLRVGWAAARIKRAVDLLRK